MDNYDYALHAYLTAKSRLQEFGSDNIRQKASLQLHVKGLDEAPKMTPEQADYEMRVKPLRRMKIEQLKKVQPKRGQATLDEIIAHGRIAMAEGAGNCFEYAAISCAVLHDMDPPPAAYDVVFMPELDHAFAVVGQPYPESGEYPMDFANWDQNAAISDGWADIVCWARTYPADWDLTMRLWNLQDKEVPLGDNKWGSPLDYIGDPVQEHKMSYRKKSSKCFITTATCEALGLPDDCPELTTLRWFRDSVLEPSPRGRAEIAQYYQRAPGIVAAINHQPDSRAIYSHIAARWIQPAVLAINQARYDDAYRIFRDMVEDLATRFRA